MASKDSSDDVVELYKMVRQLQRRVLRLRVFADEQDQYVHNVGSDLLALEDRVNRITAVLGCASRGHDWEVDSSKFRGSSEGAAMRCTQCGTCKMLPYRMMGAWELLMVRFFCENNGRDVPDEVTEFLGFQHKRLIDFLIDRYIGSGESL